MNTTIPTRFIYDLAVEKKPNGMLRLCTPDISINFNRYYELSSGSLIIGLMENGHFAPISTLSPTKFGHIFHAIKDSCMAYLPTRCDEEGTA